MAGEVSGSYDSIIVGAGPTGSFCALALAQKGERVALLEASPNASRRLAGEWLHPPAVRALQGIGIDFSDNETEYCQGKGFVVFPGDAKDPILLTYRKGSQGVSCEHSVLVSRLHRAVERETRIDFQLGARVIEVEDGQVRFTHDGGEHVASARRIIGADGRSSVVRRSLGIVSGTAPCSTMIGLLLHDVNMEFEGYGHLLCGKPGPILIYRLAQHDVRMLIDLPKNLSRSKDWVDTVIRSYGEAVPPGLRDAFIKALREGEFAAAANRLEPRISFGTEQRVLLGDAVGHYHPLTAAGMTIGLGDALALSESETFGRFVKRRVRETHGPGLLAMGVYEVFASEHLEDIALRQAIFERWRLHPKVCDRTISYLGWDNTSVVSLGLSFTATVIKALVGMLPRSGNRAAWKKTKAALTALISRLWWLVHGVHHWRHGGERKRDQVYRSLARAFTFSMPLKNGNAARQPAGTHSPSAKR